MTKKKFDTFGAYPPTQELTFALIDALAPHRDCDDVVAEQTGASSAKRP